MEHLALIFWVIIIILSIIFSIVKKKTSEKEGEGEKEEEKHLAQRKALERLLGVFSDEEQPQPVTLTTQTQTKAAPEALPQPPPAPQLFLQEQPQHYPAIAPKDITVKKQQGRLSEMDLDLIRQGIILSEILGPPRAENPF